MMPRPKILVVVEDAALRASLVFALEIEGFEITASDPAEPWDEGGEPPACIIADHRVPALDGLALLNRMRARGDLVPVIIITSNPSRQLRVRVRAAGAELVEKPLLGDALVAAVRKVAPLRISR